MDPSQLPLLLGVAVLLPLLSFFVILVAGPKLGKEHGAYWATGSILGAAVLSFLSLGIWLATAPEKPEGGHGHGGGHHGSVDPSPATQPGAGAAMVAQSRDDSSKLADRLAVRLVSLAKDNDEAKDDEAKDEDAKASAEDGHASGDGEHAKGDDAHHSGEGKAAGHADGDHHSNGEDHEHGHHINGPARHINGTYYLLGQFGRLRLEISYYIDSLTLGMFCVVTLIASCIHFYAMGYMHEELHDVTDHEVTLEDGSHLKRPGRFYRFFQYLSLFCFSMLGLVLAGNIAMVFVFWELVGICSYFLIGFYIERQSASNAANKAFIVNRVGDFGMIIGLMAIWTGLGTFAFGDNMGPHGGHLVELRDAKTGTLSHLAEWMVDEEAHKTELHLLDLSREPLEESAEASVSVRWRGEDLDFPLTEESGHFVSDDADLAAALLPLNGWVKASLEVAVADEQLRGPLVRQDGIFSQVRPASNEYQIRLPASMAAAAAPGELIAAEDKSLSALAAMLNESIDHPPEEAPSLLGNTLQWAWQWIQYGAVQVVNVIPTVQLEAERPETLGNRLGPFHAGYWLLIVGGVGIFCGCVGKSAQFPLHVWLPDAMEGPTPVSALVHSATMVAAGVYLVGRFFPTFTPEVLLTIATIGCITLFMAATIAITATDIKRVLAYSTVSQLGYMMLALGLGGWVAGLLHLVTHAFFKSLLFMCSGSVIHAVHTNEMPQMGGLLKKMPVTGITMLVGCLAIAGVSVPFLVGFSGYYSKDAILEQAFAFLQQNGGSVFGTLFFVAGAGGAAITAFYMFRLWYMTFLGEPRDQHRYDHAHESPKVMYVPLIILAVFATAVAWPGPWEAIYVAAGLVVLAAGLLIWQRISGGDDAARAKVRTVSITLFGSAAGLLLVATLWSFVGLNLKGLLEEGRPAGTTVNTQGVLTSLVWPDEHYAHLPEQFWTIVFPVTMLATATALGGILLATVMYAWGFLNPAEVRRQFEPVYRFLVNKWWFDELYELIFVKPVMLKSRIIAGFDRKWIDGFIDGTARFFQRFSKAFERAADQTMVDGFVNALARWTYSVGLSLRRVQTGRLRQYVMFIVIAALAIFVLISVFLSPTLAN